MAQLGTPSANFTVSFLDEGFKIEREKSGTLILTSLLEDLGNMEPKNGVLEQEGHKLMAFGLPCRFGRVP